MRPGENCGASRPVFVKIRNPHLMSADRRESSSVESVSGFFGYSQAVTMVVRDEMSGPLIRALPGGIAERPEQAAMAAAAIAAAAKKAFTSAVDSNNAEA